MAFPVLSPVIDMFASHDTSRKVCENQWNVHLISLTEVVYGSLDDLLCCNAENIPKNKILLYHKKNPHSTKLSPFRVGHGIFPQVYAYLVVLYTIILVSPYVEDFVNCIFVLQNHQLCQLQNPYRRPYTSCCVWVWRFGYCISPGGMNERNHEGNALKHMGPFWCSCYWR